MIDEHKVNDLTRIMVHEVAELLMALRADVEPSPEDFGMRRFRDPAGDSGTLDVTIASDDLESWVYQTGDNSYTGACYGYQYWGIGSVARDDSAACCVSMAEDMVEQVVSQWWEDN